MANFPIRNIAHERCNVLSHCKNGIFQLSIVKTFLDLILQTDSASNEGMSSDKEEYLNLALELCLEFQGKYFDHF